MLSSVANSRSISRSWYAFYRSVWQQLWDLKPDYSPLRLQSYMLMQLLTGCRFQSLARLAIRQEGSYLSLSVPATKGGLATSFTYSTPPPCLVALLLSPPRISVPFGYWAYRRDLLTAGPNFFGKSRPGCLGATHLMRYYFIQVLHLVHRVPLFELTFMMGWKRVDSVESYLDSSIWYPPQGVQYGS